MLLRRFVMVLAMLLPFTAFAADQQQGKGMTVAQFEATLHYKQGDIALPGGFATLQVPKNFRYLNPDDSERLLVAWGNPPGTKPLGMLFPADISPLADNGWGVVITYSKDGHVKDDDAGSIDYDKLLENMKEEAASSNAKRKKEGYQTVQLVGWAEPPHYDKAAHKLYWARHLVFGGKQDILNYSVRILGRKGVLEMNAVSAIGQLGSIKQQMKDVIAFTNFSDGSRYTDFNPSTDQVAKYGLAALIGGAVAANVRQAVCDVAGGEETGDCGVRRHRRFLLQAVRAQEAEGGSGAIGSA